LVPALGRHAKAPINMEFTMKKFLMAGAAVLISMVNFATVSHAQILTKTKYYIGSLNCNVSGSTGLIFGSSKDLSCVFVTANGASENYEGSIKKFGIDIGFTKAAHVLWHVYSLGTDRGAGALNGQFAGSDASLAVSASAGTTGLYGGRNNEIILESVSIAQKNAGLNFADGVAEMSLKPAP
jgi:hypothetical protein